MQQKDRQRFLWRSVPFILFTLLTHFWEWWHFGPSQRILRAGRVYRKWLIRRN